MRSAVDDVSTTSGSRTRSVDAGVLSSIDHSFDDDLQWILQRLVSRLRGSLGVVSRISDLDAGHRILSLSSLPDPGMRQDRLLTVIADRVGGMTTVCRRRQGDEDFPEVSCCELQEDTDKGVSHHLLCMLFVVSSDVRLVVSVTRQAGDSAAFGATEIDVARMFYSVLSRYFKLWWRHRTECRQTCVLSNALNRANVGVAILDGEARVLFANALALDLTDGGLGLRLEGRTLCAQRLDDDVRLQAAIQHVVRAGHDSSSGDDKEAETVPVVAIRDDHSRRPLIISVAHSQEPVLDKSDAAAVVYMLDPDQKASRLLAPICTVYGLTPVESTLSCHLVDGLTVKEAARHMRVQPDTARTYLKQIFSKTRTNRQAELVRILLSSALRMNSAQVFAAV